MNLVDIYKTFNINMKKDNFLHTGSWKFFQIDHILAHKTDFNRYKKIEVTHCILFDHWIHQQQKNRQYKFIGTEQLLNSETNVA